MTFGTLIVSFVDNMIVLSPKSKSWITWGLVMNAMKWSIWAVDTLILGVGAVSTGAPLPHTKQWRLASVKRYWDKSGIQCRNWFSVDLSATMDRMIYGNAPNPFASQFPAKNDERDKYPCQKCWKGTWKLKTLQESVPLQCLRRCRSSAQESFCGVMYPCYKLARELNLGL